MFCGVLNKLNIGCWNMVLSGLGRPQFKLADGGDICGIIVSCEEMFSCAPTKPMLLVLLAAPEVVKIPRYEILFSCVCW